MTTLTDHQHEAVKTVVSRLKGLNNPEPLTYIGGYAGTGKSTILPFILEELGYQPEKISFVAPTGKAAKVMRSKLKAQAYPNTDATTIHSAIYRAKPAPIATLENDVSAHKEQLAKTIFEIRNDYGNIGTGDGPEINLRNYPEIEKQRKLILRLEDELSKAYREDDLSFQLNPDAAIQMSQLIVVDEASMVGKRMAFDLMQFGVPILAMGDPGQLPPVKDDAGLTAGLPDFFLKEIHRQALDNPIIKLATLARQGKDLPLGKYGTEAEVLKRKDYFPEFVFETRPQFIVGTNKTRWKINQMLREEYGFIEKMGQKIGPRVGEPLIVKKNTKQYPNLVNGTECTALTDGDIHEGEAKFMMSFEDDEGLEYKDLPVYQGLFEEHFYRKQNSFSANERTAFRVKKASICMDWAYAITCHSSQGSQWDDVVVIDESSVFGEDADRHLYTAVTRAAKTLKVLV